jgi:hypothetical protein
MDAVNAGRAELSLAELVHLAEQLQAGNPPR